HLVDDDSRHSGSDGSGSGSTYLRNGMHSRNIIIRAAVKGSRAPQDEVDKIDAAPSILPSVKSSSTTARLSIAARIVAALLVSACFNPRYPRTACGPHGECPDGFTCLPGENLCSSVDGNAGDASTPD